MRKIFKFPLEVTDYQIIEVKSPAILLSVAEQNNMIMMYAMVDDLEYGIPVDVRIIETGHPIKDDIDNYKFLGTVKLVVDIESMFHIFARHSKGFVRENKEEDIAILRIDEFINFKEKGRSPQAMMV